LTSSLFSARHRRAIQPVFGKYAIVFTLETLSCLLLAPFSFVRHAVFFPGKDISLHSPLHFQAWAHTLHKLTLYL